MNANDSSRRDSPSARWPTVFDYFEAMQNSSVTLRDEELRRGAVEFDGYRPLNYSGTFADVFRVNCPETGVAWAVKLFKNDVRGLRDRYRAISEHLAKVRLPFMVDFDYQEEGVRVNGRWYPIVKLRWVEGLSLHDYVVKSLSQPRTLDALSALWRRLAQRLRDAEVAHADLQHGNVVLVPDDAGRNLQLKLIDYDGMYVPAVAAWGSHECGHPNYQHPQRGGDGAFCLEVDRFSHLAICCALRCLSAAGRPLWERFGYDEGLLFREADFAAPAQSAVFQELWTLPNQDARTLVGHLALAARRPLQATPLVDELISPDHRVRPWTADELREIRSLWTPARPHRHATTADDEAPTSALFDETPDASSAVDPPEVSSEVSSEVSPEAAPRVVIRTASSEDLAPRVGFAAVRAWVVRTDRRVAQILGPDGAEFHKFLRVLAVIVPLFLIFAGYQFVTPHRAPPEAKSRTTAAEPLRETTREKERAAASARSEASDARDRALAELAGDGDYAEPKSLAEGGRRYANGERAFERSAFSDAERWFELARSQFQLAARDASYLEQARELRTAWERGIQELDAAVKASSEMAVASRQAELAAQAFEEARYQTAVERYDAVLRRQGAARKEAELTSHWQAAVEKQDRVRAEFVFQEFARPRPNDSRLESWNAQLATLGSARPKSVPSVGPELFTNDLGMTFRHVPAGVGKMGERVGEPDERPEHQVRITSDFYLGIHEVTQRQYVAVMMRNPSRMQGLDLPVESVTAAEADEFCQKLSERELALGRNYRLPTEAEWEYAARAGTTTKWCSGDREQDLDSVAWWRRNSDGKTHVPEGRAANGWGLYDMHGNVAEWCRDDYDAQAYVGRSGVTADPIITRKGAPRVVRGGSWSDDSKQARSAFRYRVLPEFRGDCIGFRVVLVGDVRESADVTMLVAQWHEAMENKDADAASIVLEKFLSLKPRDARLPLWRDELATLRRNATVPDSKDYFTNSIQMRLRWIPAGEFTMGTQSKSDDERPPHRVTISRGFFLGVHEVTQRQYSMVMGENPSHFRGDDFPVESVTVGDAEAFCRKLTERERDRRRQYQLPTEAQWEYAARADTNTLWCLGDKDTSLADYAWYLANSKGTTHAVGAKKPNAWGLFDMHGNVYEWCQDDYDQSAYALRRGMFSDPLVRSIGRERVVRGGAWAEPAGVCRSARRYGVDPTTKREFYGFRVTCYVN